MDWIRGIFIAVSMYSRIPAPRVAWNRKSMRYAFAFFPLVGTAIGFLEIVWFQTALRMRMPGLLRTSVQTVLPVLITGEIHLDGFLDTVDARSSYGDRNKRRKILKDPHTGAFAVIYMGVYYLLSLGAWSGISGFRAVLAAAFIFPVSRSLSGITALLLPKTEEKGSLKTFADSTDRRKVLLILFLTAGACAAFQIFLNPAAGVLLFAVNGILIVYYKNMAEKQFGGLTGDLAGWFLSVCELLSLLVLALCHVLIRGF